MVHGSWFMVNRLGKLFEGELVIITIFILRITNMGLSLHHDSNQCMHNKNDLIN